MAITKNIEVKFQREGFHKYPNAPEEVSFLRHRHRHIFHYEVLIEVFHSDRELEFFIVRNWMLSLFEEKLLEGNSRSCETLAEELVQELVKKYGSNRSITVSVSEDGENGGMVTYHPD